MNNAVLNSFQTGPDEDGRFGIHGGRFVAETLMPLILSVEQAYRDAQVDPEFERELRYYQTHYICLLYTSPSPRDLSTSRMPSSA